MKLSLLNSKMMNPLSGFCPESIRLMEGSRRCEGQWQLNLGEWKPVYIEYFSYDLKEASIIWRQLDCGAPVSATVHQPLILIDVWTITSECLLSGSDLKDCAQKGETFGSTWFTCIGKSVTNIKLFLTGEFDWDAELCEDCIWVSVSSFNLC